MRFVQGQADNTPFMQLQAQLDKGKGLMIACFSAGSRERLQTLLLEHGFHSIKIDSWSEHKNIKGKTVGLAILPLEQGFETEKLYIFSTRTGRHLCTIRRLWHSRAAYGKFRREVIRSNCLPILCHACQPARWRTMQWCRSK